MNKHEAIKKVEQMGEYERFVNESIPKLSVLNILNQLDEPRKAQVPQFVADWYEEHKDNLEYNIWDWMKYNLEPKKRENVIFSKWLGKTVNNPVETLIKMKLYGYEVEKEKRYRVKMKGVGDFSFLNHDLQSDLWLINNGDNGRVFKSHHTCKELEDAGFGEVFDSQLFEVEEVTE